MYSSRKLKKLKRRILFHVVAVALLAFAVYITIFRKDDLDKRNVSSSTAIQQANNELLKVN
jgi:hypothetical protein